MPEVGRFGAAVRGFDDAHGVWDSWSMALGRRNALKAAAGAAGRESVAKAWRFCFDAKRERTDGGPVGDGPGAALLDLPPGFRFMILQRTIRADERRYPQRCPSARTGWCIAAGPGGTILILIALIPGSRSACGQSG